jgi:hypothetical protein
VVRLQGKVGFHGTTHSGLPTQILVEPPWPHTDAVVRGRQPVQLELRLFFGDLNPLLHDVVEA